ncbi:hypothetical protein ACFFJX_10720 [Pseudarcicella hirudinis]
MIETQTEIGQVYIIPNCDNSRITAYPSAGGYKYEWYKENTLIAGQSGSSLDMVNGTGLYKVVVTGESGCSISKIYNKFNGDFNFTVGLTGPVRKDICGFNYEFSSTVPSNSLGGTDSYAWYVNNTPLVNQSDQTKYLIYNATSSNNNSVYKLNVSRKYNIYGDSLKVLNSFTCTASAGMPLTVNFLAKTPVINQLSCACNSAVTGTLMATGCGEGGATVKWSNGATGPSISVLPGSTVYTAKCVIDNCEGAPSEGRTVQLCGTAGNCPNCTHPFGEYGSTTGQDLAETIKTLGGNVTKSVTVNFEALCIPDWLILSIQRVGESDWDVLLDTCVGDGIIGSNSNSASKTFTVYPGDKLKMKVKAVCRDKCADNPSYGCYKCDNEGQSAWRLSFSCQDL